MTGSTFNVCQDGQLYSVKDHEINLAIDFFNQGRASKDKPKLRADTAALWIDISRVFTDIRGQGISTITLRQLYYQLVSRGSIKKTEAEYKRTMRQLRDMRRGGFIPYEWVADNTRWMRRPNTHHDLLAFCDYQSVIYRKAIWDSQPRNIEIWCEKDALAGVIYTITSKWDVPLYVVRGYSSDTLAFNAMNQYSNSDKPLSIYYFGDWDPSGKDVSRDLESKLQFFADDMDVDFSFERVAVLPDQIGEWSLPTRPTKMSDPRSKTFTGESVELDAIPPRHLQQIVNAVITQNIDHDLYERTLKAEKLERDFLSTAFKELRPRFKFIDTGVEA
jgi:hypothetical protein